jgi:cytochrome c biogenesis protein
MGFTIVLLLVLVLVSTVGVIVPQRAPDEVYIEKYGALFGRLVPALGFDSLFSVWWYVGLWTVVVAALLTCSITRLPKYIKSAFGRSFITHPKEFGTMGLNARIPLGASPEDALTRAREVLKRKGLRWHEGEASPEGLRHALAQRGGLGRLGPFITHISLVIILVGGLLASMAGSQHHQAALGGQSFEVPDLSYRTAPGFHLDRVFGGLSEDRLARREMEEMDWRALPDIPEKQVAFEVRVEDFVIETTPEGKIADYKTTATVLDPDSLFSFVIEVNKPLVHKGYYFYQSSYGYSSRSVKRVILGVTEKDGGGEAVEVELPFGRRVAVPGTDIALAATDFASDFVFDIETRTAGTRSESHRNPAVKIDVYREGERQFDQWLLMRSMGGHSSKDEEYSFAMLDYDPVLYTVLEVRTHPVMGVIWTGCGVMVVGVFLSFYVNQRRVWVAVRPGPKAGAAEVFLAGASRKDRESFRREFEDIVDALKGRRKP